nr:PREDICTED: uncharacterized protein LOC105663916 [Megachile rotundata]
MPFAGEWCRVWIYFGFVFAWAKSARPRFDTSTDMGLVLVPADAEVDSVIFRLRATDQDADFPLVFEITGNSVVRIDNLPCTLYNKVCQANVILTKRLVPGRLHDFAIRVRDTKGDSNSMQATISVTNATTPRDKIFPHIPSLIMVPEDTKPGKELDYLLVRANPWSGKPVYIELWQPKELFTIRQRQTPTQTRGVITLIGELDFETQSMYALTMYATDPYTEPGKDTRNIAGLSVVVVVQDVQDVPPIFTLAPPLTRINNSVQPGDIILRVHAEDGDKGVPREIVYGLVSESNPFTPFFNISETSGEITLARPLEELTQITHVGAPVVLTVVAEEIRRSREEPPAQATVVDVGFLLGEPGNSPPYFESDNYMATIDENLEPGTVINFGEQYSTKVKDEDIGKAGVFALKLENNNSTFEINPTVAERTADFVISVRDNSLIDYELYKVLSFKIVAQEVGPATNLSTSVPITIFIRDINDNPPIFEEESYEITLSENVTAGSRVLQVHATDKDTGAFGSIRYTSITGEGSEAFTMDPDTGLITVAMGSSLDREIAARLVLSVEARDENGSGNRGVVPLIINLLDVNDNAPVFEKDVYQFMLNSDLTNFTSPAFIKAIDADAEPPNNVVRYELIHGNYENKFYLNETSGELILRSPITKIRRKKQSVHNKLSKTSEKNFIRNQNEDRNNVLKGSVQVNSNETLTNIQNGYNSNSTEGVIMKIIKGRRKRDNEDALYSLTARAYDLGVPHLSSVTQIQIFTGIAMEARIMMFVVPGEQPDSIKTAETLAAITGGRVTVLETRPYVQQNHTGSSNTLHGGGKKSIVVARVEQTEPGTPLVDVEKIREALAANGVGIINGTDTLTNTTMIIDNTRPPVDGTPRNNNNMQTSVINNTSITSIQNEEVTVYKAENKLLLWLLIILGLLMLLAIAILIICCIHPGCPFYMAPRKRRVHSSETLVVRSDGRPKRHLHRQPAVPAEVSWNGRKQAWSADPTRRNWQFNKRNVKNCSLPGDVAYVSGQPNDIQMNAEAKRLTERPYDHSRRSRMEEQDRLYMEDMEGQKARAYGTAELDSLQRHEMDRGSDVQRHPFRQRYMDPAMNEETSVREQHFYREGNAEVLRLVTRGQVEDTSSHLHHPPHHHRSTTLIVDGKDIILQRFIEDQKSRHELSVQDIEAARSMESHQRSKEMFQQQQPEIILIPEKLDLGHRQHVEEIGPNVQRLVIDHGDYDLQMDKEQMRDKDGAAGTSMPERPAANKDVQPNKSQYSFHDLELARQNALLTRLLLERESKRPGGGGVDSTSYLETQSLPGQVAIATQTDRTTATQTERHVRSRSDNDESDEESKHRRKLKSRKKYSDGEWRRTRTLWMKSPIEEEGGPCFDKRLSILRKKVKEVKEGKKISLEPEILREISDSLDGNGSSYKAEEDESRTYRKSTEQTSISYKILNEKKEDSQSSEEARKRQKSCEDVTDDQKKTVTESTSSTEMKIPRTDDKSPKKEGKAKTQKKSDNIIKPSFKILEKEFTMLTKKLSKLGDKRFQESTGSDSTSQEKLEPLSKDSKKNQDRGSRKTDSQKQTIDVPKTEQKAKQKKEAIAKTKQKLKYQQTHVMSTGSSEYDDALEKPKKVSGIQDKQKHPQVHPKLKRQAPVDRRELKTQMAELREEETKRRHSPSKGTPKIEDKGERRTRSKLALSHRGNVSEETSTSTEDKKDPFNFSDFKKKSGSVSSDKDSSRAKDDQRKLAKKGSQRFSDDFIEEFEATTKVDARKDAKSVRKEMALKKEEFSGDKMRVIKNGVRGDKVLDEKLKRTEESTVKRVDDSQITVVDDKRELIKDIEKFPSSQIESVRQESEKHKDEGLMEKGVVKLIESVGVFEESMKIAKEDEGKISKSAKDTEEVQDKVERFRDEQKMLDDSKRKIEVEMSEKEETMKPHDEHESLRESVEKLFEDREMQNVSLEKVEEVDDKHKISVEKSEKDVTKGVSIGTESKCDTEEKADVEKKELGGIKIESIGKTDLEKKELSAIKVKSIDKTDMEKKEELGIIKVEDIGKTDMEKKELGTVKVESIGKTDMEKKELRTVEVQSIGKTDLVQKIEPIEHTTTIETPKSERDSMQAAIIDNTKEHKKEDILPESDKQKEHIEHKDVTVSPVTETEETKMKTQEDKKEEIRFSAVSDKDIGIPTKVDDSSEKNIFLDKKETEDVAEITKDSNTTTDVSMDKKITSSEKEDISSAQKEEFPSPQKEEVPIPQKEEITGLQKEEFPTLQKEEVTSPPKKEITSPQKEEVTRSQKKEIRSPQKEEITSSQKEEVPSPQIEEITSPREDEINHLQIEEITSPPKEEISHLQIEEITSPQKEEISHLQIEEITSPQKEEISHLQIEEITSPQIEEITSPQEEEITHSQREDILYEEPQTVTITEIIDDQMDEKKSVFPTEEKIVDIITDKQSSERESTFFDKETTSDEKEALIEAATTGDQEMKGIESISSDKGEEKQPKEGQIVKDTMKDNQITKDDKVKEYQEQEEAIMSKDTKEDSESTKKDVPVEAKEDHDQQKQVITETKIVNGSQISKRENIPEDIKVEKFESEVEKSGSKVEKDISETKDEKADDENILGEESGVLKMPVVEKQESETSNQEHEGISSNVKEEIVTEPLKMVALLSKDDQTTEKTGVFAEMFGGIRSIVDKLVGKEESVATSTETETASMEALPHEDKVMKEEISTPSFGSKDKDSAEVVKSDEVPNTKMDSESLRSTEHDTNIEEIKDKFPALDEKEVKSNTTKEQPIVEETRKSEIEISDSKQVESPDEETSKMFKEEKESIQSTDDKLQSPTKTAHEEEDLPDIAKESVRKSSEVKEPEIVPENGTTDELLVQNSEKKGEPSKHPTSLPEISALASSEASKEKFALDSITAEVPADSEKAEPGEQSKLDSERAELQEVQPVVEQISTANEDETRSFPGQPAHTEQDTNIISEEEANKQAADVSSMLPSTENVMTDLGQREEPGKQYADVSLPLFTSIIDTMDDSDDSDSSSDISRKTTLTTRPYQTPRHRVRQSPEREQTEKTEVHDVDDEEKVLIMELDKELSDEMHEKDSSKEIPLRETHLSLEPCSYGKVTSVTEENLQKKQPDSQFDQESSTMSKLAKDTKTKCHAPSKSKPERKDDKKARNVERKRVPLRGKKSSSEESSEERAMYFQERQGFHKKPDKQPIQKDGQVKLKKGEEQRRRQSKSKEKRGSEKQTPPRTGEIDTSKAQPKYMAWYKKNREEMEKKRAELMATDEEDQLPRWLRRSMKSQKSDKEKKSHKETTPRMKRKVKPLVNVESEQLKAIVRQGRKLRRAEGGKNEDPPVQIFATTPPAGSKHHLVQHSEYKYEKIPAPFYLHPPPVPHPSPQLSPQHFEIPTMEPEHVETDFESGIAISLQGGNRLRHQQLLEKKSVFDIAYSEAAPSQLRSDSTTPPS